MSEFRKGSSGSSRFDTFCDEKVSGKAMSDEEYNRRRQERREKRERDRKKNFGKKMVALCLSAGMAISGLALTFGPGAIEKSIKESDYNDSFRNHTWDTYGTTTYPDDLSEPQYNEVEYNMMAEKADDYYDSKNGEGAFDQLDKNHQNALVGEVYHYYGKDENIPEDVSDTGEQEKKWAHAEIAGEDKDLDINIKWFDNKN